MEEREDIGENAASIKRASNDAAFIDRKLESWPRTCYSERKKRHNKRRKKDQRKIVRWKQLFFLYKNNQNSIATFATSAGDLACSRVVTERLVLEY